MTDQEFQQKMLEEMRAIHKRFDTLSSDLHEFQSNQESFNSAIWNLNNQAFQAINDIRSEVLPPWKARKPI